MATAAETMWPLLFGTVPMDAWPVDGAQGSDQFPWSAFVSARRHLAEGDQDLAIRDWSSLTTADGFGALESRHVIQAWTFLRSVGIQPDASIAHEVHGVVAEVAVDGGHDTLAAYRVGGVRYLNHAGGVSVVETEPPPVAEAAAAFLDAGAAVAATIGPWAEPELPALPVGHTRFTMLTPAGPHLGQGPDEVLRQDAMAGGLVATATQLLVAVVDLSTRS